METVKELINKLETLLNTYDQTKKDDVKFMISTPNWIASSIIVSNHLLDKTIEIEIYPWSKQTKDKEIEY